MSDRKDIPLGMASFQEIIDEFNDRDEAMITIRILRNLDGSGETEMKTTAGLRNPRHVAEILRKIADSLMSPDTTVEE